MQTYIAVISKEPDSAFGAWFPDVPGCFSAADAAADIGKNAIEALRLHLAEGPYPAARGIEEVKSDPEVAAALRAGSSLLAVRL